MNQIYPPIFISGPHGGGKSTLVDKLKNSSDLFLENDFDIDFTIDFPSISSLSHFERSLMRLYHRFFITNYAQKLAKENPVKVILTNRTVYDSEAYINAYHELKWISEDQFQKLDFVIKNFSLRPYAIILNPPLEVIKNRLGKRRDEATRTNRDKIFKNEDSDEFLENLYNYFTKFKNRNGVVYVEDNNEIAIQKITAWVKDIK
ncbi:MAG: deoxynucleoside kinase [Candidatus Liptonbacteria bacterium]|nr:deoxynucleoside kinase [Candidatus Liptonbacteria bacterium]